MARILGFHPRGPGSIPGVGDHIFTNLSGRFLQTYQEDFYNLMIFDVATNVSFSKLLAIQNSFLK